MKLLVITRKVDVQDERMGFFVDWLNRLSYKLEKLYVICLEKGDTFGMSENIEILSMGKEKGYTRLREFMRYRGYLSQTLPLVDGVFVHMNPLYANLAGLQVRRNHKKMILWYTHRSVDSALKKTEKYVDGYATASRLSFRLKTSKPVYVLGHGIPIQKFSAGQKNLKTKKLKNKNGFKILSVGRIAPSKGLETLIEAIRISNSKFQIPNLKCLIIGAPALPSDEAYLQELKDLVKKYKLEKSVKFIGPKSHYELPKYYKEADVFVNLSSTGSVDKVVLEAMVSGALILTSNEAFQDILGKLAKDFMFKSGDSQDLALRLQEIYNLPQNKYNEYSQQLQKIVEEKHNLDNLIDKIILLFK